MLKKELVISDTDHSWKERQPPQKVIEERARTEGKVNKEDH